MSARVIFSGRAALAALVVALIGCGGSDGAVVNEGDGGLEAEPPESGPGPIDPVADGGTDALTNGDSAACVPTVTTCPTGSLCGTVPDGCGGEVNCGTCTAPLTCGGGGVANQCGCVAATTCPSGQTCGTADNGCGGTVDCGACTTPETCGGGVTANACGCTPATTCPSGQNCGTVPDGCGGTIPCGSCTAPETCGGGTVANQCGCIAATTCPSGQTCGTASDGCGGTIQCGTCGDAGQICSGGVCANTCATTCPVGQTCGSIADGCGGTLDCGSCAAPETCSGGTVANQCGCTPVTTCPAGQNCGTADNGCGGTIDCGSCTLPQSCGGGSVGNQCGCSPATQCPAGQNCGTADDGCGGTIDCGNCTVPQSCGGGAVGNQCGCTPATVCPGSQTCGTADDGCGGTIDCGTCSLPQTCGGGGVQGQCGCTPGVTCPGGQNCGSADDGCGGTMVCGSCVLPETCGGGGSADHCGCTPAVACPNGFTCGTAPNGCGGQINCGSCLTGETCNASNRCEKKTLTFFDSAGRLIGEYDGDGVAQYEIAYMGASSLPLARMTPTEVQTIHTDHLGTPRALAEATDKIVWKWDGDAFGASLPDEDPDGDTVKVSFPMRFPGQLFDEETGLHYNFFRDYDPQTGRYLQADPIGLAGGVNLYGYVRGQPVTRIDPRGLADINRFDQNSPGDRNNWRQMEGMNDPNMIIVGAHGHHFHDTIRYGRKKMTPESLADEIRRLKKWKPGMPVVLRVCDAGRPGGLADQLARLLGTTVYATPRADIATQGISFDEEQESGEPLQGYDLIPRQSPHAEPGEAPDLRGTPQGASGEIIPPWFSPHHPSVNPRSAR